MTRSILLFFMLLFCGEAYAQHATNLTPGGFRRILISDGIPSSEVYEVYQDRMGYLWLATDAGICRYNGITFTTYTTSNGLPDNTVFHIKEDSHGRIWVQTFTGEIAYFAANRFQPIPANPSLMALYGNGQKTQYTFFVDQNDDMVVGGLYMGGCYRILQKDNYSSLHHIQAPFAGPAERQIWTDSFGQLYAIGEGLYYDEPRAMIHHNGHELSLPLEYTTSVGINMRLLHTRDNRVLFSHREMVFEVFPDGRLIEHPFPGTIIGLCEDASGDIWVNMLQQGTLRYPGGNLAREGISYLRGYSVSYVVQDTEKGYWFSTVGKGVFYRAGLDFGYITTTEGLPSSAVYCLAPIGNGKIVLGQAFSTVTLISTSKPEAPEILTSIVGRFHETSAEACGVFRSRIFANTDYTYHLDTNLRVLHQAGMMRHIKGFTTYPGGDTLIAFSHSTIVWCDTNLNEIKRCFAPERIIAACYQGHTLWLGGLNGLWKMNDTFPEYYGNKYPGLNSRIDDMVTDGGGRLWLSTRGDGVFVFDQDTVHHFDRSSGLGSNTCRSIATDEKDNIWVATNNGISVITNYNRFSGNASIETFNVTDGLLSNEVNQILVDAGIVYMAGPDGVCWIPANKLLINLTPPPVYIASVIAGKDTLDHSDTIILDYGSDRLRILCEGISLRNSSDLSFRYKLTGSIDEWTTTQSREISFGNLEPGDYTFIIYALNSNGVPSVNPATVQVHINRPFTKTIWFYALISVLGLAAIFLMARMRVNVVRRKVARKSTEEQRMAELRLSALRAQMNPHFIFNAINSIQHYILHNDSDKAYGYLAKFSKLIRLVLDQSQHKTITLKQELEILGLYLELEQLRFEHPIRIVLNVSPEIDQSGIRLPGMLVQPYVENAVWHGLLPLKDREGLLSITIREENESLLIVIEDNGIGRIAALEGKKDAGRRSYGMLITSERLKLMGRPDFNVHNVTVMDLHDDAGKARGTRVEITIGLSNLQD